MVLPWFAYPNACFSFAQNRRNMKMEWIWMDLTWFNCFVLTENMCDQVDTKVWDSANDFLWLTLNGLMLWCKMPQHCHSTGISSLPGLSIFRHQQLFQSLYIAVYICIYHIYVYRERDRCLYTYIYIYVYLIYICVCLWKKQGGNVWKLGATIDVKCIGGLPKEGFSVTSKWGV